MDYEKDYNEILKRLENLRECKREMDNYDPIKEGCNKMIHNYLFNEENKDDDDSDENEEESLLYTTLSNLKEKGMKPDELLEFAIVLIKESEPYIKTAKEETKAFAENKTFIESEIANIMLSDAKTSGVTERSKHFPHFGTVKCKLTPVATIKDKSKVIECIAKDAELRDKYLSVSKTITKFKDVSKIDGIEMQDEYVVTVRTEKGDK